MWSLLNKNVSPTVFLTRVGLLTGFLFLCIFFAYLLFGGIAPKQEEVTKALPFSEITKAAK